MLTEQGRMVKQIAAIVNELTYHGQLKSMTHTDVRRRMIAQDFLTFSRKFLSTASSVLLVNVGKGDTNFVQKDKSSSRFCDLYAIISLRIAIALLQVDSSGKASIAIITGYKRQKKNLVRSVDHMIREGVKGADRIVVNVFDAVQGEQYDYVILDILINQRLGFLADPRRMTVALTRAKSGVVIIGSKERMMDAKNKRKTHMTKLWEMLKNNKFNVCPGKGLPDSLYFEPSGATQSFLLRRGVKKPAQKHGKGFSHFEDEYNGSYNDGSGKKMKANLAEIMTHY